MTDTPPDTASSSPGLPSSLPPVVRSPGSPAIMFRTLSRPGTPPHPRDPLHIRRPSSSLSSHSRRASMLSQPDPSLPHRLPRTPSVHDVAALTQLHQELECEQEAQVNHLLGIIRQQKLANLAIIADDNDSVAATIDSGPRSPVVAATESSGRDDARAGGRNRSVSRGSSVLDLRSHNRRNAAGDSASEHSAAGVGNDPSFFTAQTQMLMRENEMLKNRIRELEEQVRGLKADKQEEVGKLDGQGSEEVGKLDRQEPEEGVKVDGEKPDGVESAAEMAN